MTESSTSSSSSSSFQGLIGATVTVLVTTLDDSVWLVRFVGTSSSSSSSSSNNNQKHNNTISVKARIINALTFLLTLLVLAVICCVVATVIETTISASAAATNTTTTTTTTPARTSNGVEEESQEQELLEVRLQLIAAILCWSLAIGFYIKKQLKEGRGGETTIEEEKQQLTDGSTGGGEGPGSNSHSNSVDLNNDDVPKTKKTTYDSILPAQEEDEEDGKEDDYNGMKVSTSGTSTSTSTAIKDTDDDDDDEEEEGSFLIGNGGGGENEAPTSSSSSSSSPSPCTVISLTFLGFLDEMSYFPTLIVGNIFTSWELIVGALLAGIIMLTIQIFLSQAAKLLVDWFDRHIKLYHIIGIFA
eukprot:CAMPEP_0113479822 /NCGR_PEP_ID=MMETSP0014_2-20120614/21531_1 /TAXON_ID=2857 /ORGANISM="Nitzschia sp." /LENGTH=358 /DNA_ID=CAMNT_0000373179 /DNA_START=55 /DNA_END=1127 /DNA_ORIENTATION=+ /assembly_acc=CAM_ASM_000159